MNRFNVNILAKCEIRKTEGRDGFSEKTQVRI